MLLPYPKHFATLDDISEQELEALFARTDELKRLLGQHPNNPSWETLKTRKDHSMAILFEESSLRTSSTFERAGQLLGMFVNKSENAKNLSSYNKEDGNKPLSKGESFASKIHIFARHNHVLVIRHGDDNAAERAVKIIRQFGYAVSIVDAGSGMLHHTTQTGNDLYIMDRAFGGLRNIDCVVIGGDGAFSRTFNGLSYGLARFAPWIEQRLVTPEILRMDRRRIDYLKSRKVKHTEIFDFNLKEAFKGAQVIYWNRTQKERHAKAARPPIPRDILQKMSLGRFEVEEYMGCGAKLMHPQPIDATDDEKNYPEIREEEITGHPKEHYREQAANLLPFRMAILEQATKIPYFE